MLVTAALMNGLIIVKLNESASHKGKRGTVLSVLTDHGNEVPDASKHAEVFGLRIRPNSNDETNDRQGQRHGLVETHCALFYSEMQN